jgi:integrase
MAAASTRYAAAFELAILTGLRRGELLALRWQDIDLDRGILTVRQTMIDRSGTLSFSTPKTHRSRRSVDLSSSAVALLKAHRRDQAEERLVLGPAWHRSDLVFTSELGTPVHPRNRFRAFRQAMKVAGVTVIRFHALRHSHATLLFKADVHPKVVSERLGHATVGLSLDTYSHVQPGMQREAVDKLDAMLGARRDSA